MRDLVPRYLAGEHEAVWDDLRRMGQLYRKGDPSREGLASVADVDEVLRLTFERVARNVDRLIERLEATGYRFESRAGRYGAPVEPRRPAADDVALVTSALQDRFGDLPAFIPRHEQIMPVPDPKWTPLPVGPMPRALEAFGRFVGTVDLGQRHSITRLMTDEDLLPPGEWTGDDALAEFADTIMDMLENSDDERFRAISERAREDYAPHPHAGDPVLSRLGDWDPLVVDFEHLAWDVTDEEEAELMPLEDGGLALHAEIAPSFEHKANVSGAWNPTIRFPFSGIDPIVHAEGIRLPFTTYLRRCFARGGFFGVPRVVRSEYEDLPLQEVEPGIFLPDHPIFADLAEGLEPF